MAVEAVGSRVEDAWCCSGSDIGRRIDNMTSEDVREDQELGNE